MLRFVLVCLFAVSAFVSVAETKEAQEKGFTSLFDGKTLSGWTGEGRKHFSVEAGNLVCYKGCEGKLLTEREYSDFILRFDFKLTPGANNGVAIRAPKDGVTSYAGIELQILDNSAKKYQKLEAYQFHGSAYGIAPAKRGALKPVGEWNSQEVRCEGRRIQVILNGKTILNTNLDQAAPNQKTIDHEKHPGLLRNKGYVGFLCHKDPMQFRNIRIQELPSHPKK